MTPSARLQAVLELLTEIDKTRRPADTLASGYFRARRYIGSKDRGAVSSMLYDILRHHARLKWWLGKIDVEDNPRAHLLVYSMLVDKKSAAQVDTLFDGKKFAPQPLEKHERALLKKLEGHTIDHPNMPENARAECPEWAAESLKRRFGKRFMREMRALLESAPLDIRVNTLKTTREEMLAEIRKAGIAAEPCPLSPWGIRIENRPALNALPMLKNGLIEIQDEGSQLVALIVNAKPGQRVVDFCAGAGGKTLAIAAQMKNKGRITACDVLSGRLTRSTERFRRAGLHNIEIKPLKSEQDPWIKRHKSTFDRALVDAPCSGTGAWRRNPDSRWRSLGPGLENLLKLQANILESAARLVKPGGRLIYATCSLLPEENEEQINRFLAAHTEFRLLPFLEIWKEFHKDISPLPSPPHSSESYLSLTPEVHKTDGFFGAVMERA